MMWFLDGQKNVTLVISDHSLQFVFFPENTGLVCEVFPEVSLEQLVLYLIILAVLYFVAKI